jgi:hypothetical protein
MGIIGILHLLNPSCLTDPENDLAFNRNQYYGYVLGAKAVGALG